MEQYLKEAIKDCPGDYVEIRMEEKETTFVNYSGKELEDIGKRLEKGGCIRVCHKGGWGFLSFNEPDDISRKVEQCYRQASMVGQNKTKLAKVPVVHDRIKTSYEIDPRTVSLEEKEALMRHFNDMILSSPGVQSTRATYRDFFKKQYFLNSEGSYIEQEAINTGAMVAAIFREGSNIQQGYKTVGQYQGFEIMKDFEIQVEEAIKQARALLKAEKVKGGQYTVILDPELAGVFAHEAFGHLSESDFLDENPEIQKSMRLGRRFGSEILNIVDEGNLSGEQGFIGYDEEGIATRKNYLIQKGVLVGRLHSRETAAKMGEEVTGNARAISYRHKPIVRMTNTYIEPGQSTFEEMISTIEKGLYVIGMLGGNTDLEKFTFSSKFAYEINQGKTGALLRDVILSGNVFDTLNNIESIGNDLELKGGLGGCGKAGQWPLPVSTGAPHIKINNVIIGGR